METSACSPAQTLDDAKLTPRYWACYAAISVAAMLEFFDIYVVGFLVATIGPKWGLTFSQAGLILLSAGVGAICGGLLGGVTDKFGRKTVLIAALILTSLASASAAFLPAGSWLAFSGLRFLVGLGQGALAAAMIPLTVEWTPARYRTLLTTVQGGVGGAGVVLASVLASVVLDAFGWRGLALLGLLPLPAAAAIAWIVPESPRWLASRGDDAGARKAARRVFRMDLVIRQSAPASSPISVWEPFRFPRRVALIVVGWAGYAAIQTSILTWGPSLLSNLLRISPAEAARMFTVVSTAGVLGSVIFAILAQAAGRSPTIRLSFAGVAILMVTASWAGPREIWGVSIFFICLAATVLVLTGVASNLGPYSSELWSARLAGRGAGLGQAAGGVGKVAGPALLAAAAGSSHVINAQTTQAAIAPTFLMLAAMAAVAALVFTAIRIETRGVTIELSEEKDAKG